MIVSLNLKDIKYKVNVKDDDRYSSMIVSLNISNNKFKPKDDRTKCIVKSDDCSSSLIVSLKLPIIRLKTSNPKKDAVIFTHEEPPNQDNVRRRQRYYVYYPGNEEFQRRWCEILNLKFVTAAWQSNNTVVS